MFNPAVYSVRGVLCALLCAAGIFSLFCIALDQGEHMVVIEHADGSFVTAAE